MLKFSAKGEYALLLVQYLVRNTSLVTIGAISQDIHIPETFLRKIVNDLERAAIIVSKPGRNGGIALARKSPSVYDVLQAIHEDTSLALCEKNISCDQSECCNLRPLIHNLQRWMDSILKITKIR